MKKVEKAELPWYTVEESIQRLRETGMLEWIYHLRPDHSSQEDPKT